MKLKTIKTDEGEIFLNVFDDDEIDVDPVDLEDTIDLTKMVNYDETEKNQ